MWTNPMSVIMKLLTISMIFEMLKEFILEWRLLSPIRDRLKSLYEIALELRNYVMG